VKGPSSFRVGSLAVALCVAVSTPNAGASVTIGQVAPPNPPASCGSTPRNILQPTVTSGNSYVVAGGGTITSWSTSASAGGASFTLKIWRKIGEPAHFQAVRHDGPHVLAFGVLNSFTAGIPVAAGDYLGFGVSDASNACTFDAPGDTFLQSYVDLPDGASAPFSVKPDARANVAAVIEPSNAFDFGDLARNKKRGSATLALVLPGPGTLTTSGKGVKPSTATATQAGNAELSIKATGKAKHELNDAGKTTLRLGVLYTPTGGSPGKQAMKVKLKKN
jgi:hypothetical protein